MEANNGPNTRLAEGEALFQRLSTSIAQSSEKLRQIFLKMDVMSSGKVSPEELELALSHIGVFLTTREYEKLYMALGEDVKEYTRDGATNGRWRGRGGNGNAFTIKYAEFLALFRGNDGDDHRTQALPSNSSKFLLRLLAWEVLGFGTCSWLQWTSCSLCSSNTNGLDKLTFHQRLSATVYCGAALR